jgi:hypothetical protein
MFEKKYEDRLVIWSKFRETLEESEEPFRLCRELYNKAPLVSIYTDPWDITTWPDPWQLLDENRYCEFNIVLGMCYSLQLTERFSKADFEIHICIDEVHSDMQYLLIIDNNYVLGYDRGAVMTLDSLPKTLKPQQTYRMQPLQ